MPYVPNNNLMFTAAYAGALAGMGASGRQPTDPVAADYAGLATVAGAFAQAFDMIWGVNPTSELDLQAAEEMCEGVWQGRSPQAVAPFTLPSNYTTEVTALVAMIKAGEAYFASQGIPLVPINPSTDQISWFVNALTGNDSNVGSTSATAVKTLGAVARRLSVMKYSPLFGPYQIKLETDIPNSDSAQFSGLLSSIPGNLANDPDTGVTEPLFNINGTKTVIGSGSVAAFVPPAGNAKCTLTRVAGAFALNDIVEFTSGPAAGKRCYPEEAGATTTINPNNLGGAVPAPGDTFNLVQLTKLGCQITWQGGPILPRINIHNVWIPGDGLNGTFANGGSPQWEVSGCVMRFNNCLINQYVRPGIAGRSRFGSGAEPSAFICQTLGNFNIERGQHISFNTSYVNVVIDVMTFVGAIQLGNCETLGSCIRCGGGSGEIEDFGGGAPSYIGDNIRQFDVPAVIPASPYVGTGGTGDVGAGLIVMRGFHASVGGVWAGLCGAGVTGLRMLAGGNFEKGPGAGPTITGGAGDIAWKSGVAFPHVDATNAIVVSALTSWAGAGGFTDPATFNGSALDLHDGTVMYSAP